MHVDFDVTVKWIVSVDADMSTAESFLKVT